MTPVIGHRVAPLAAVVLALWAALTASCKREERNTTPQAPATSLVQTTRLTSFQPGQPIPLPQVKNIYESNAPALSEAKELFESMNCRSCHAAGGGDIGPPLKDDTWRYGGNPDQVYASIMQGRPNGMPSYAGKLTDDQAWKLAAYVRSMSGQTPSSASPGRDDHMRTGAPEQSAPKQKPKNSSLPPSAEKVQ
jgi:cytochrome c oxidase cbb3-type subunit 3